MLEQVCSRCTSDFPVEMGSDFLCISGVYRRLAVDRGSWILVPGSADDQVCLWRNSNIREMGSYCGSLYSKSVVCLASSLAARFVVHVGLTRNLFSVLRSVVRFGDLDLYSDNDGVSPININVSEKIPHPQYTSSPVTNDIGLIRLETAVTFTSRSSLS